MRYILILALFTSAMLAAGCDDGTCDEGGAEACASWEGYTTCCNLGGHTKCCEYEDFDGEPRDTAPDVGADEI